MTSDDDRLRSALIELASIAGIVANVCDHAEHNEAYSFDDVGEAADRLRDLALELAAHFRRSPAGLYAKRLAAIERRNVVYDASGFDGERAVMDAATWRDLQLVQIAHDRYYHADVVGLAKYDQLRHCALHLAKLAGATADVLAGRAELEDYLTRRVADMLLFGIKLASLAGQRLASDLMVRRMEPV
jgi:hypothetical protein